MKMAVYQYEKCTAEEIQKFGKEKTIAILNIGAIEQHGPHLPVGTDCFCGTAYLMEAMKLVKADVNYLVLPMMPYSCSIEHSHFPGTITLKPTVVIELINTIGENLMRAGIQNLIITSGHGGNEHVMEIAARELRVEGMHTYCVHNFLSEQKLGAPEEEVHAGAVETGVLMALGNDYVRINKIKKECTTSKEKWFGMLNYKACISEAWLAEDVGVDGVCGAPELANGQAGKEHIQQMAEAFAEAFDAVADKLYSGK